MSRREALGDQFATRTNALTFVRLCLTFEVLAWHAYSLRGDTWLPSLVERQLGTVAVDCFFAISGFLICRAWCRRPEPGRFLLSRARRLLPGLWVCLLVTAFVIAPVAAWLSGTAQPTAAGQWTYVLTNADTWVTTWGIDGGPTDVPWPGAWDGSLWSLGYEVVACLAVLGLGVLGRLRAGVVAGAAIACWVLSASLVVAGWNHPASTIWLAPHLGLMYFSGALLWLLRDRVPVTRAVAAAAGLLVVVGAFTPDHRLLAAPALAYLSIVGALWLGRFPQLLLRRDLSYGVYLYGFPVQQALLVCGVSLGWAGFALLSVAIVVPLAMLSWWFVERPARRRPGAALVQRHGGERLQLIEG
jgi:peptidoglycan/LPS O-acetylase OafA/YrhL